MSLKELIADLLEKQFGVDKSKFFELNLEFEERGKRRVYAFKGKCGINIPEYHYGIYFGTLEKTGIRLSIEGCYIIGKLATKNVLELEDEKARKWMAGEDIEYPISGYVILKWRKFYLGCGKGNGKVIRNYVPKERRISSGAWI